ncbi:GH15547 [Drosophila grimshawi]|uniref:GH15547 n=1 Tax=Drosophila grimshawi TaxID=7222 RepID=B4J1F9_DROGR|nr:GH15547 [Drosophila grimshawi]
MCNLLWLCVCLVLPACLRAEIGNETDLIAAHLGANNSSDLLPSAEKLVRFRRHPGYTIRAGGSKRSKQRRRIKSPKLKVRYASTSYAPGPKISSYYKPSPAFPAHLEEPSFSLDAFQHLKFDSADFQLPPSSYEAQSMDLDLYGHGDQDLYGAHKFPSLEYSFVGGGHESPSLSPYEHKSHKPASVSSSYEHKPHQKYGVPPQEHQSIPASSYEAPESFVPHHYEPPPAPPSTKYGVPAAPSYTHSALPPPPPPAPDSYSIYEQKIPNVGYHHQSFAEPPQGPPTHSANFEISHSKPAYEISTSYQANEPQYENNYQPPAPDHGYHQPPAGHDYQPSAPAPGHNYQPPVEHSYQPSAPSPGHSYNQPAPDHSYLPPAPSPSEHSYLPPAPHPSDHSYLPPAPPPSDHSYLPPHQPTIEHNYQPAHDFAEPPAPPAPPQQHPSSSYAQPEAHLPVQSYPQENYAPPSEELPLSPHHKFPSFDFPKSSYEVPIYDPIPFESNNREEHESYPPILPDESSNELPLDDAHAAGSSRTPTKSRKRKRPASSLVVAKKHTLDVPELQQAYDADSHVRVRGTDLDTAAHGTRHVQQKRKYATPTTTTTTTTTSASPWNPMRSRTTPSSVFLPTVVTSTPHITNRSRGHSRYRNRNPSTESAASSTVVTIEKSRSQSYYDGTIAPPTYQHPIPVHSGRSSRPTRAPVVRHGAAAALLPGTERNPTLKRTTKGIFDTTLFKSPQSDREMERQLHALRQNLPKNHKLY